MSADPETLLFARFRDGADVGALGELYDRTAAELLRVAFHLVRDPARAEDLVQQTFVAAIEGASRFDAARGVRAWLLGILANQARKLQRTEARVPPAGVDASIDPLAVAQTQEFTAAIDAAISALPEVYQPVLVLHLKHGMIAAEIAHALRRPPGTVRTQLMRALELLKKALPPSIAVGACLLLTPLRGLAAIKEAVLADAAIRVAATAAVAAAAAATTSLAGGALLMKKVVAAVACAIVLAIGSFAWLDADRSGVAGAETYHTASLVQATPVSDPAPLPAPAPAAMERELQVAPTHGTLRYRFLWEEDRTPAAGVVVQVIVWARPNPLFAAIEVRTDQDGEIALNDLEPGRVSVGVDRADGPSVDVVAGQESAGTYLIPRGIAVDVTVQDEQQQPISSAHVWLSHYGSHMEGHEVAVTNAAGRATLRDVAEARYVGVRADGYAPPDLAAVRGKPGERMALTLTMASGSATLHGVVRDAKAQSVAGARVWIGGFARVTESEPGVVQSSPPAPVDLRTDASGRFEARGLPAGHVQVWARAVGSGTARLPMKLRAGETQQCNVTLPDGASIVGFVRDEAGRGIAGAWIGGGAPQDSFGQCTTRSAGDGAFALRDLTPGRSLRVSVVQAPFLAARQEITLAAGEQRACNFVLKSSRPEDQISGQLVDANGAPLVKWIVEIRSRHEESSTWNAWLPTDADGRFVARECREQQCHLQVFGPDGEGVPYPFVAMDVERGASDVRVVVPAAALERATMSGQCVGADGKPVVDASVNVHEPGVRTFRSWQTDASGRFRTGSLPPRTYRLDVSGRGMPVVQLGERTLVPKADFDLGTIVLPRGGRVALTCRGISLKGWLSASVHTAHGESIAALDDKSEPRLSPLLAPGRYQLRVVGGGVATVARDVEIIDGETTSVEIALEAGCRYSLAIREPRVGAWHRLDISALDAQGKAVWGFDDFTRRGNEEIGFGVTLGVGTWQVRAKTDTGLTGTATIHVTDATAEPAPVVIELR